MAKVYDLMGTDFVAATIAVWSWGQYLDAIAAGFLVTRLEATHAAGFVTFFGPEGLEIVAGAHVAAEVATEDQQVKEYEVTEGGEIQKPIGPPEGLKATTENTGGGLADGNHYYVVTAVNSEGESTPGEPLKVVLAAGGDGIVDLSWKALAGANSYRVYHGNAEGGPFSFLAEVSPTAYKDDGTPAPDATVHPPSEDTTGDRITLPVEAVEPGAAFNSNAGEVTVQVSDTGAESLTNVEAIGGGTDAETDEALLGRLLERFDGIGPGNIRFYKVRAGEHAGVGRVAVVPLWDGPNTVLVIVLTEDGGPVSNVIVEEVQAALDPVAMKGEGQSPIGHEVTVATAEAVKVDVAAEIEFEDGYSLDGASGTVALREPIKEAMSAYMQTTEPGGEAVRAKVGARIASFEGVHDFTGLKLNGKEENVALSAEPAQVAEL
ncbi:MAG TPA: baseplate J/gp47 family protein, partial [Candidatus Acidoferrum sp.]|nr:baseplate J/gp47 family protein [Candidatus Acidoferrum sp.]